MIDEWKSGDEAFVDNLVEGVMQQMSTKRLLLMKKKVQL